MAEKIQNFLRLTRPLSNVKNIALIFIAFYIARPEVNASEIVLGFLSISFICSAFYAFNTLSDYNFDKKNENKKHYLQAVEYFGKKNCFLIFIFLLSFGLIFAIFINGYFLLAVSLLALTDYLYSSKYIRFKEKFVLDVLFGAVFTFLFRFLAFWYIFSFSSPPLLVLAALVSGKSAGYLLYKEVDRPFLSAQNVKNSITLFKKYTIIFISILLWIVCLISIVLLCIDGRYLPFKFLILLPFALPPLAMIYLSVLDKIKTKIKFLRTFGFVYWFFVIIIAIFLIIR